MNTKLDLLTLVSAFATSEGYFTPGTVPAKCFNPTDLRFAGQFGSTPSQYGKPIPFAQFSSEGVGVAAAIRQFAKYIQEGFTLRELVYAWAPPTDGNNSELYLSETIRRVKAASGLEIDPTKPLIEYLAIEKIP